MPDIIKPKIIFDEDDEIELDIPELPEIGEIGKPDLNLPIEIPSKPPSPPSPIPRPDPIPRPPQKSFQMPQKSFQRRVQRVQRPNFNRGGRSKIGGGRRR